MRINATLLHPQGMLVACAVACCGHASPAFSGELRAVFSGTITSVDATAPDVGFFSGQRLSGYFDYDPESPGTPLSTEEVFYYDAITEFRVDLENGLYYVAHGGTIDMLSNAAGDGMNVYFNATDVSETSINAPLSSFTIALLASGNPFGSTEIPTAFPPLSEFDVARLEFFRFVGTPNPSFVRFTLSELRVVPEAASISTLLAAMGAVLVGCSTRLRSHVAD